MSEAIERVLAGLEGAGVDYLVVGGVAVVLHGHLRTTGDLDLVLRMDDANIRRALEVLAALGFRPRLPVPAEQFALADRRREWIEAKGMTVFSLWDPGTPAFAVDLFAEEPFDFEQVHGRALRVPLATTTAAVIGLADLIEMKRAAGRARDQDDLLHLEALAQLDDDDAEAH